VSVKMRDSWPHALSLSVIAAACCVFMNSLAAQMREPNYQFEFTVQHVDDENNSQSGTLELRVLPPNPYPGDDIQELEGILRFDAKLHAAQWLVQGGSNVLTGEQEVFVLEKFRLFKEADKVEQYQQLLDPETYLLLAEAVSKNEVDLASDQQFYSEFDDIRLLASIRYGVYTLLYTQFRSAVSGELITSVMPARHVNNRLVTAGILHQNSHELYRMLVFGTLQLQFFQYLEERVKKP